MALPRKISQLPALLALFLVCALALLLAPAGAGAWRVPPPVVAQKAGAAKHLPAKHCRGRGSKSHRGCHPLAKKHSKAHGAPAAGAPAGGSAQPPVHPGAGPSGAPRGSSEEAESEAPEAEAEEEEEEEGPTEEEEPAEEEGPSEETEAPAPFTSAVPAPTGALRWAPPTLVEPKTITLGTGYTHTTLATNRDYIVKLPPTKKVGGTWIDGGHNVVIVGGYITVPQGDSSASTNETTALSIKGATGTVHVEGVLIDGSGGGEFDGVTINAPQATVQLENLRIVGVQGSYDKVHADVVQPWGGVKDLRIDRLTGRSNYQGLTLKPDLGAIGSAEIEEVDLTATTEGTVDRGGHMLWLTRGLESCETFPTTLSNVFVTPRPGTQLSGAVWPQKNFSGPCPASGSKSALGWTALPVLGNVQLGPPASGSYVPAGAAGLNYQSPGYRTG
jgi:hypothetical protein